MFYVAENQDYDVHGIFSCEGYWDWVHLGKNGYDINLYELTHTLFDIKYQHFTIFMNFSNPFFLHPKFDYKGFMSFCGLLAVKRKVGDMTNQIKRFHYDKSPRTALHAYRIPMVCLHHAETGNMERNIFKLNEKYGFTQLTKLKQVYNRKGGSFDVEQVNKDLAYLQNLFNEKIASFKEEEVKVNMEKAHEWFNRMRKTFGYTT